MRRRESPRFEDRVLDEMITERLRGAIDFELVATIEAELSVSVERAMDDGGRRDEVTGELVYDFFRRAWDRISREMLEDLEVREVLRDELAGIDGDSQEGEDVAGRA